MERGSVRTILRMEQTREEPVVPDPSASLSPGSEFVEALPEPAAVPAPVVRTIPPPVPPELVEAFELAFGSVRHDLDRARELFATSFTTLQSTFQGLEQQMSAQASLLKNMSEGLMEADDAAGDGDREGFVELVSNILQEFVDELVRVSRDSMDLVQHMNTTAGEMERVERLVNKIKGIAVDTKFVSLNALINANHRKNPREVFAVFASEVRALSDATQRVSLEIDEAVQTSHCTIQTMKTKVEHIASRDMSRSMESRERVDDVVTKMSEVNEAVGKTLESVAEQAAQGVRSLQFDDILTQLVGGIEAKLGILQEVFVTVGPQLGRLDAVDIAEIQAKMDSLGLKSNHVTQETMDAGDVELF